MTNKELFTSDKNKELFTSDKNKELFTLDDEIGSMKWLTKLAKLYMKSKVKTEQNDDKTGLVDNIEPPEVQQFNDIYNTIKNKYTLNLIGKVVEIILYINSFKKTYYYYYDNCLYKELSLIHTNRTITPMILFTEDYIAICNLDIASELEELKKLLNIKGNTIEINKKIVFNENVIFQEDVTFNKKILYIHEKKEKSLLDMFTYNEEFIKFNKPVYVDKTLYVDKIIANGININENLNIGGNVNIVGELNIKYMVENGQKTNLVQFHDKATNDILVISNNIVENNKAIDKRMSTEISNISNDIIGIKTNLLDISSNMTNLWNKLENESKIKTGTETAKDTKVLGES